VESFTIRASEIAHEQRIIETQDLGAFYRFVNKRISNRSCVGAIATPDGTILTNNYDRANAFNAYFSSVNVADNGSIPDCRSVSLTGILDTIIHLMKEMFSVPSINLRIICRLGPTAYHTYVI